ncbi:unnamed protein product [Mortierella alpina]
MKFLRTRLASFLVVASTGSLALLAGVSGVNTNPQTQGLYRRDHGPGHHEHHQHHHHRNHTGHQHKHHAQGGKGKQGGPHHKAKDKHHKKPNMPTYKIFLMCSSLVVDSIQCPIRPTDPGPPPSCHAMNNGAAVTYVNMQEPCSEDLPQTCSTEMAASLSEDTIEASGAKPNPAFKKSCVAVKTKRHHAFKDLCVAVGDFCGNKLYGCDFVATTQYRCDAIGEHPRPVAENAASCGSTNACLCPASSTGLICGGELPKECKAYMNSVYDCSGGAGTTPKLSGHCEPGVLCRKDHELKGATCGSVNCECFGDREVCSESFPAECDYEKNTIYRCTKSGVPVKMTECLYFNFPARMQVSPELTCRMLGARCQTIEPTDIRGWHPLQQEGSPVGAACGGRICECPGNKDVCFYAFPDSCALDKNAIYNCTSSGSPTKTKICDIDEVCVMLPDGAVCNKKPCVCPTDGDICGSVFPQHCKIPTGSIYFCVKGQTPFPSKVCALGGCTAGSDKCNTDPCKCQENGDVCGSTFPKECQLPKDTLYSCTGKNATPMEKMACSNKGCVPTAGDDVCGSCLCPNGTPTCGSVFGPECKMDNSALYRCSSVDALPSLSTKCPWGCDVKDGPDECNSDCQCKDGDNVCGSVFPAKCGYKPGTLYKCPGALADPSALLDCVWGCDVKDGPDTCNPECRCKDGDSVCGSVFPAKCGYKPGTLYKCSGALADPLPLVECPWGCDVKDGPDKCNPECQCKDGDNVCGSVFPAKCGYKPGTLYECSGALADPLPLVECPWGCDVKDGPDKCNTDCQCKDGDDVCGSMFPAKCGFTPNSLYKCPGALATPSSPAACPKGCDVKIGPDTCGPTGTSPAATTATQTGTSPAATTATPTGTSPAATTGTPSGTSPVTTTDTPTGISPATTTDTSTGTSPATTTDTPTGTSPAATPTCMAESGHIVDRVTNFCVGVNKLVDQQPVVLTNCTDSTGYVDWRLSEGRMKSDDNQFCLGYHYNANGVVSPMVLMSCNSTDSTIVGWTAVNGTITSAERNFCVDRQQANLAVGTAVIAYPCVEGSQNQQWILPTGWVGC